MPTFSSSLVAEETEIGQFPKPFDPKTCSRPNLIIDFDFQDEFAPRIFEIVGGLVVRKANHFEDRFRATDIVSAPKSVAARVRRLEVSNLSYLGEFTLRAARPNGLPTEFEKIMQGHGDWFFYGFAFGGQLVKWIVIDLAILRSQILEGRIPHVEKNNKDGSATFRVYRIADLPPEAIIETFENKAAITKARGYGIVGKPGLLPQKANN